ncbi:hypothetical protein CCUS01_05303 [Colletotrichum cuscutae]|uniref:Uncharacterized protein n=1 Tax=Colletotrichum cuscutae TaxID=1209917 RepID=A0AAI9VBR6_9PEZI|nr:hypothetical protein CCUS01_05303 [Colletotrichum cuscutae]
MVSRTFISVSYNPSSWVVSAPSRLQLSTEIVQEIDAQTTDDRIPWLARKGGWKYGGIGNGDVDGETERELVSGLGWTRRILPKEGKGLALQVVATENWDSRLGFAVGEMREDVVRLSPCHFLIARHEAAAAVHTEPCRRLQSSSLQIMGYFRLLGTGAAVQYSYLSGPDDRIAQKMMRCNGASKVAQSNTYPFGKTTIITGTIARFGTDGGGGIQEQGCWGIWRVEMNHVVSLQGRDVVEWECVRLSNKYFA